MDIQLWFVFAWLAALVLGYLLGINSLSAFFVRALRSGMLRLGAVQEPQLHAEKDEGTLRALVERAERGVR